MLIPGLNQKWYEFHMLAEFLLPWLRPPLEWLVCMLNHFHFGISFTKILGKSVQFMTFALIKCAWERVTNQSSKKWQTVLISGLEFHKLQLFLERWFVIWSSHTTFPNHFLWFSWPFSFLKIQKEKFYRIKNSFSLVLHRDKRSRVQRRFIY